MCGPDAAPVCFGGNTVFGAGRFQNTSENELKMIAEKRSSALILWHLTGSANEPLAAEDILRPCVFCCCRFPNKLAGGKMLGNKLEARKRGTRLKALSKGCKQAHKHTAHPCEPLLVWNLWLGLHSWTDRWLFRVFYLEKKTCSPGYPSADKTRHGGDGLCAVVSPSQQTHKDTARWQLAPSKGGWREQEACESETL